MMESGEKIKDYSYPPYIQDKKVWNQNNILWAALIGLIVILVELLVVFFLDIPEIYIALLSFVLILLYAILLFFLLEPHLLREVTQTHMRTIEKPVVKIVEKPIIRERIRVMEKPVEKKIYVPVPSRRKKLNIHKYKYFGSGETKTFHKRTCRFRKLIKRKYQHSSDRRSYFTRKKYKTCKICKP